MDPDEEPSSRTYSDNESGESISGSPGGSRSGSPGESSGVYDLSLRSPDSQSPLDTAEKLSVDEEENNKRPVLSAADCASESNPTSSSGSSKSMSAESDPLLVDFKKIEIKPRLYEKNIRRQRPSSDSEANEQLEKIGLMTKWTRGDGSCLFNAICDQKFGHQGVATSTNLRLEAVEFIKNHPTDFIHYAQAENKSFQEYVDILKRNDSWAGIDALIAIANLHRAVIWVHQLRTKIFQIKPVLIMEQPLVQYHVFFTRSPGHYETIRKIGDFSKKPANVFLDTAVVDYCIKRKREPSSADDAIIAKIVERSGCQDTEVIRYALLHAIGDEENACTLVRAIGLSLTGNDQQSPRRLTLTDPLAIISDSEGWTIVKGINEGIMKSLELSPDCNYASRPVLKALTAFQNSQCLDVNWKPGNRVGNKLIDKMALLCHKRALEAFDLKPDEWGVKVQQYSGTMADFALFTALVEPNGRIMGLDLPNGGPLTIGYDTGKKKISATSISFQPLPYKVNPTTGYLDYEELARNATLFKPKLVIAGVSCYSRNLDYKRFREICDANGAYLMADMAHISGMVAAKVVPSPFEYADVVTTTTHKSFRGPRAGVIFYRKGVRSMGPKGEKIMYDLQAKINAAVFPGLRAAPHINTIAAMAVAMGQAKTTEFVEYQRQVLANAQAMCRRLKEHGYAVSTGGTDNHLCLVDMRPQGLDGARVETVLEIVSIACNKNTCPGDKSALKPGGIRLGSPALTSRGLKEADFEKVIDFIHEGVQLTKEINPKSGNLLKDFKQFCKTDEEFKKEAADLRQRVEGFASKFSMPGFEDF